MGDLADLMEQLGYRFRDKSLLERALTHKSYSNEHPRFPSNERLEFLGDAAISFMVSSELFRTFPQWDEGKLTVARSALVGCENMHSISEQLNLSAYIMVGEGEKKMGSGLPPAVMADAFEALIGAAFVDGGMEAVKKILAKWIFPAIARMKREGVVVDPKCELQELFLKKFKTLPVYVLEEESGPDHQKVFTFSVASPDGKKALGVGTSKRRAQREAAKALLELLK